MAITSSHARGLSENPSEGDVPDEDLASECGGNDRRSVRGYVEEGLEDDVDVEGCVGCTFFAFFHLIKMGS